MESANQRAEDNAVAFVEEAACLAAAPALELVDAVVEGFQELAEGKGAPVDAPC